MLMLVLLLPLLAACGEDSANSPTTTPASITTETSDTENATPPSPQSSPVTAPSPVASPVSHASLTPAELKIFQPNELGGIPIFMYHNIVTDPTLEGHLYRAVDEFYADLQWLYDNDFYLVGMNDVVRGQLDVPAGKHPVVLTFDDSSSMHLSFQMGPDGQPLKDDHGDFMPTPNCAVGIIEAFAAKHPDFGKTAHFAVIPGFKFSWPEFEQDEWIEEKLQWLLDHGYEIGNHTQDHQDLSTMFPEDFARNIAGPVIWSGGIVDPNDPNYAMGVLTLPFGAYPPNGWEGDQFWYLRDGFVWDGHPINVEGVLLVCCGAAPSPFNTDYNKMWIPRIRGDDPDFERFANEIEQGWIILYTSDGNPETVTVPWPLPESQWGKLNKDAIVGRGLTLVKYKTDTGKIYTVRERDDTEGYNCPSQVHISA